MRNSKKKGFTIVELVIGIAVIGILSAVLIPTFAGLVNKANQSALQQNLANAYTTYASTYEATDATLYTKEEIVLVDGTVTVDEDGNATIATGAKVYTFNGTTYTSVTLDAEDSTTYAAAKYTYDEDATPQYSAEVYNGFYAVVAR